MTKLSGSGMRQHLQSLPDRMQREMAAELRGLADTLVETQRAALRRQLAPPEETGALENSIRREQGRSEIQFVVRAGGPTTTTNGYDRALAFEFGTEKQPARPFFYPAYREMKRRLRYAIVNAVTLIAKSEYRNPRVGSDGQVTSLRSIQAGE